MATDKTKKQPEEFHEEIRSFFGEVLRPPWIDTGTPNRLDELLDVLVPRGGTQPSYLCVSLEDYLSRLAVLSRKIDGVRHRKEQWDKIVDEHLSKFQDLKSEWQKLSNKVPELNGFLSCGLRNIRVENEFEVILYSICGTLSALTKVIATFLKGNERMHSHSRLPSVLLHHDWGSLADIVSKALYEWIEDVVCRRDAATHYVALTAESMLGYPMRGNTSQKPDILGVAITRKPIKYVPLWLDNVPVIGGTSTLSTFASDNSWMIKDIRDTNDQLILQRSGEPPLLPEMIDGREYINVTVRRLEDYIADVLRELLARAN
jgi:hypothetical protein